MHMTWISTICLALVEHVQGLIPDSMQSVSEYSAYKFTSIFDADERWTMYVI